MPQTAYEALQEGAAIDLEPMALTFFLQATAFKQARILYRDRYRARPPDGELLGGREIRAGVARALGHFAIHSDLTIDS